LLKDGSEHLQSYRSLVRYDFSWRMRLDGQTLLHCFSSFRDEIDVECRFCSLSLREVNDSKVAPILDGLYTMFFGVLFHKFISQLPRT